MVASRSSCLQSQKPSQIRWFKALSFLQNDNRNALQQDALMDKLPAMLQTNVSEDRIMAMISPGDR
jgi:hypothetical protein